MTALVQRETAIPATAPLVLRHEILVLDAYLDRPLDPSRQDETTCKLVESLLATLGMEILGPLQVYAAVDERAPGWSFIQPITTSHISGHYFEKPGRRPHIHMDIYSCEQVNYRNAIGVIHQHLQLERWTATFIIRDTESVARQSLEVIGRGDKVLQEYPLVNHGGTPCLASGR